ncbi:hypothetical protein SARC_12428, partial [Sphaeroforma arctica JP610]
NMMLQFFFPQVYEDRCVTVAAPDTMRQYTGMWLTVDFNDPTTLTTPFLQVSVGDVLHCMCCHVCAEFTLNSLLRAW